MNKKYTAKEIKSKKMKWKYQKAWKAEEILRIII